MNKKLSFALFLFFYANTTHCMFPALFTNPGVQRVLNVSVVTFLGKLSCDTITSKFLNLRLAHPSVSSDETAKQEVELLKKKNKRLSDFISDITSIIAALVVLVVIFRERKTILK